MTTAPVLVGRTREQVFLREELTAATKGRGRLVLLGGEAGIGKTSLARDLAVEAEKLGGHVLTGHCYDLTNTPPYGPWLDLFASYRPDSTCPPPPTAFAGGRLEAVDDQVALFADVRQFFTALAEKRTSLVVLEDLHWADPASLSLLRHVAPALGKWPILLLATYRVDELTRRHPLYQQLPALVREAEGLRLDLHRLDSEAFRKLVVSRFMLQPDEAERLASYLERHSEGNPFYATEILRDLEEEKIVRADGQTWTVAALDQVVVPALLQQVIDGRISRLGEETRQSLVIASVIGQEVPLDLWRDVAELENGDLLSIVERAVEAHLLEAERDGARVRFVHALTREALYQGILPPRRRNLHLQVAERLAANPNADPDVVAFHFQAAGDPRAIDWLIRAGERAQRAYALLTAFERFREAAHLLSGVEGQERNRGWLLYRLARLQRFSNPELGIESLVEAERLAGMIGDEFLAADARYSRGILTCYTDDFALGNELVVEGVARHEQNLERGDLVPGPAELWLADALPASVLDREVGFDDGEIALRTRGMHHRRGSIPWNSAIAGKTQMAIEVGESFVSCVEGVERLGVLARSATGHALQGLAIAYTIAGRPEDARRTYHKARDTYLRLDHHAVIAFSLLTELRDAVIPYQADWPLERRRLAAEAEAALYKAGGALLPGVLPELGRLSCLTIDGRWDDALAIVEEIPPPGHTHLRREVTDTIAYIARHRGTAAAALEQIHSILSDGPSTAPGSRNFQEALFLQRLAAELLLEAGEIDGARGWLEANDRWLDWHGSVLGIAEGRLCWARYFRVAGDGNQALKLVEEAIRLGSDPSQPLVLLAAHRLRGEFDLERRQHVEAERHFQTALELATACECPFEIARTKLALAELRAATGATGEAISLANEVRAISLRLQATPTLLRANALSNRLAAAPVVESFPMGLTQREVEVLRLIAQGLSDASAAEVLSISPRTVGQHLRSIYGKLGVSSRSAATRFAIENKLG